MSNSLSSALVPDTASDRVITVLGARLASLACFQRDFSQELADPTRPISYGIVTDADEAVVNPVNFESNGNTTVGAEKISPQHISKSFHITQAELNSGHMLEKLFDINLRKISHAIMDLAMAPITVANFGPAHIAATPADLDGSDLNTLWGDLSDADERNIMLKGDYYASNLPTNQDGFQLGDGAYGFDKFRLNNRFDGAGPGVVGFVGAPEAMGMAARVPAMTDQVSDQLTTQELIMIPGLDMTVQFCTWASLTSRATWGSFDLCFGAALGDPAAGKIIATA